MSETCVRCKARIDPRKRAEDEGGPHCCVLCVSGLPCGCVEITQLSNECVRLQMRMQTGIAAILARTPNQGEAKHLRVGLNTALVEHAALADLLVHKGVITKREYLDTFRDWLRREVESYERALSKDFGAPVNLGPCGLGNIDETQAKT